MVRAFKASLIGVAALAAALLSSTANTQPKPAQQPKPVQPSPAANAEPDSSAERQCQDQPRRVRVTRGVIRGVQAVLRQGRIKIISPAAELRRSPRVDPLKHALTARSTT